MTIDADLQSQVDAQLLEQGSFGVLDFLMDSGRLLPRDYERWRRGELGSLDEVLMGSSDKIRSEVEKVAQYAKKIGLVQQQQTFHAWHSDTQAGLDAQAGANTHIGPTPLLLSTDANLSALIAGRFVPAQDAPQLDLFFDNPVVALTNGIVRALSVGDHDAAQRALDRLYAQAPNHADLPAYDRLLDAAARRGKRVDDPRRELALLQQITPTAKRLMGTQAGDLLTPLWRQLADALRGHPLQPDQPDLHRSFALCQSHDWDGVTRSVLDELQWWLHAPLCLRLAQSSFHQRHRTLGLTAWFHLCWRAPREAADALDHRRHPDTGMAALWRRFIEGAEDASSTAPAAGAEGALETTDFPAWLLLQEPGLTRQLAVDLPTGDTPAENSYRCVHRWTDARRAGRHDEEMALRKRLQATNPVLFDRLKRSV